MQDKNTAKRAKRRRWQDLAAEDLEEDNIPIDASELCEEVEPEVIKDDLEASLECYDITSVVDPTELEADTDINVSSSVKNTPYVKNTPQCSKTHVRSSHLDVQAGSSSSSDPKTHPLQTTFHSTLTPVREGFIECPEEQIDTSQISLCSETAGNLRQLVITDTGCEVLVTASAANNEQDFLDCQSDPAEFPGMFDPILDDTTNEDDTAEYREPSLEPCLIDDFQEDEIEATPIVSPSTTKSLPIYPGSQINLWESFLATLCFAESEHISGAALGRLIKLISLHLPPDSNYFKTNYSFFKLMEGYDEPVRIHYYCNLCMKHRSTASDLCDVCTDSTRSVIFFLSFSLKSQLSRLFKRPGFLEDIQYRNNRTKINPDGIEDIYDGKLYKEAVQSGLSSPHDLSFMWNTDGLQVFNSSSFSLWAWYFVINELPPHKRFLSENMLVAGIWGSTKKPHPNVFLQPIHKELQILQNGVKLEAHGCQEPLLVKVIVLCGTCDAPALALFLNIKTYSGYFSCHICYCKGENSKRTGEVTVFPYQENVPLRTKADYKKQVDFAVKNKVLHNSRLTNEPECSGIKGPTFLSYMVKNNNIFDSTAIDAMHCIYLGVMRQLLTLWFDHIHRDEPFSVHSKIQIFNEKMFKILPPHFLQRHPQGIDKLCHWKASELRSFFFNLSLFILCDILKQEYFDHFLLLVQGVALLNSSSITNDDLVLANMLLDKFVRDVETLYGVRHMSHNMHMLLHLSHCVQNLGPLHMTSCFKFEDMNGRVLRFVHGSRHVALQIHTKLSIITDLTRMVHNLSEGPAKNYCKTLQHKWMRYKINCTISNGVYCVGNDYELQASQMWVTDKLLSSGVLLENNAVNIRVYHRLLKDRLLFVSSSYVRGRCVSSYVKYSVANQICYGNIDFFLKVKSCSCSELSCTCLETHLAVMRRHRSVVAYQTDFVKVQHVLRCHMTETIDFVQPIDLKIVMFKVGMVDDSVCLSEPLNYFELE